jgi:uncharacterized membrane protein YphA (DoxX/SURF4 family)
MTMSFARARSIGYWATTGILAVDFLASGMASLARPPAVVAGMEHLGYPAYFGLILGTWKVLGAIALLLPRFPRLKEWAYAGIFFDVTGAAVSHAASGDGVGHTVAPLVFAAIAVASWALRPASRTLGVPAQAERESVPAGGMLQTA